MTGALDDSPCVASTESKIVERFTEEMKILCAEISVPLAPNSPMAEKAFELVQRGTVLGMGFDSTEFTWHLAEAKANKVVRRCLDGARAKHLSLEQVQKIMGSVNDVTQMCPLLKGHQRSGNAFMTTFGGNRDTLRVVPARLRKDLETVAKVAEDTKFGMPFAEMISRPGFSALTFYMDAAGASFTFAGGKRFFLENHGKGLANIGGTCMEDIWGWSRLSWPDNLLTSLKDEKGCFFGCKSTTLESIGVLVPLITFPDIVRNKQLEFKVDNAAVMWGWQTGYVRNYETAF